MAYQIAQLLVPSDGLGTPTAAIVDWPRGKLYLWDDFTPAIRRYTTALAVQSPLSSVSLSLAYMACGAVDPLTGNLILQAGAFSNGVPVRKYDPATLALLDTFGASVGGIPSYPTSVWFGQSLVCVVCNGVSYALVKDSAFSGGVAVIRVDTMEHAGSHAAVVSGSTNNRGIMCAGASGPAGGSAFLTWDGLVTPAAASIPLYIVEILPGAETYVPATWPTTNAFISHSTVGTIAATSIDPAWTTLQAHSIGYDATDGNVLLDVTGNGATTHYIAKVNAASAAVLWAAALPNSGAALPGYRVSDQRAMFLPSGARDFIATDTGVLTTAAMAGLSAITSVMADDASRRALLHATYVATSALVPVAGGASSFTAWAILGPIIVAPDYAFTMDQDTTLAEAVVATGAASIVYTIVTAPTEGAYTFNPDGTFVYDPAPSFVGVDTFVYRATDAGDAENFDDGTVTITVGGTPPIDEVSKVLLPSAELQFIDANGDPYAAGTLETLIRNTDTPKDTWSDPAGSSLNANPIVLDSAGRCVVYGDGAYRTILRDSLGNEIWDKPTFTYVSVAMMPVIGAATIADAVVLLGIGDDIADAVAAEAALRTAADATEAAARAAADTTLTIAIAAETTRATAAEAALAASIGGLPGFPATVLLRTGSATTAGDGTVTVVFSTPFPALCISFGLDQGSFDTTGGFQLVGEVLTRFQIAFTFTLGDGTTPRAAEAFDYYATGY